MKGLTKTQEKGLACIDSHLQQYGFSPTRKDLAVMMGYSSANAAEELVRALEKKGYIEIMPGVARGITVLKGGIPFKGRGVEVKRTYQGVLIRTQTNRILLTEQQAKAAATGIMVAMQDD